MRAQARRIACLAGATAAGLLAMAAPAGSHDAGYDSRVTIHNPQPGVWHGRVFSERDSCEPDRLVKLMRPRPGPDEEVARDRTDADGRWDYIPIGERYYARVVRKVIERPGHRHVCRADESRTIEGSY